MVDTPRFDRRRVADPKNPRPGLILPGDLAKLRGLATVNTINSPLTLAGGALDIQASSAAQEGSMSAAQADKLAKVPARSHTTIGGNVALNNASYTSIISKSADETTTVTVVAYVTLQSTTGTAQTARLRMRINGTDVDGAYSWVGGNEFMLMTIVWTGAVTAGQTIEVRGLVGTGTVSALANMPDGAFPATVMDIF